MPDFHAVFGRGSPEIPANQLRQSDCTARCMRLPPSYAVLVTAAVCSFAQSPSRFAGAWVAMLNGTAICTLEIEGDEAKPAGVSRACKISVDQNGELLEGEAPDGSGPVQPFLKPKVDGPVLRLRLEITFPL